MSNGPASVSEALLVEGLPVGLSLCTADGRLAHVNGVMAEILGRSPGDLLGVDYAQLLHPDDRASDHAQLAELIAGTAARYRLEHRYLRPDGELRWVVATASLAPEADPGNRGGRLVVRRVIDITERRQAEAERDRLDAQLRTAQAIAHLGSWEWDFATRRTTCSEEVFRIFGFDPADAPSDANFLFDRVHPSDRELVRSGAIAALESATPFELECRIVRTDGVDRIVFVRGRFVPGAAGRDRMVGTIQDVTEWRVAEAKLRESEERFRRLFEEGPMGVAVVDQSLRFLQVNDPFAEMLGQTEADLYGRSMPEITHPDDVDLAVDLARKTLAGELPGYDIENRFVRSDGDVVWGRVRVTVVRGDEDKPLYGFVLVEDITEAKEAERLRREYDAMKDGFVRVVSHDLQGPLATIAGLADLLSDQVAGTRPDQGDILRRIAAQSERLHKMVATFLNMDRLYQGGLRAARRRTELGPLVDGVVKALEGTGHPLAVEVTPVAADVDPDQLEHILENLLENAFTHTDPGTPVWLRVGVEDDAVVVVVEDAGPGVPQELKQAIFELFRTGATTGRTGIGLWTVARFAELHGGTAWVEERAGGGARFQVVLPKGEDAEADVL